MGTNQLQPLGQRDRSRAVSGRARSALKHGMTASTNALVPGEDPTEQDELVTALFDELDPSTTVERLLVERLANAFLRMRRADLFVQSVLLAEGGAEDGIGKAFFRDAAKNDGMGKALRHGASAERSALMLLHELQRLKAAARGEGTVPVAVDINVHGHDDPDGGDAD